MLLMVDVRIFFELIRVGFRSFDHLLTIENKITVSISTRWCSSTLLYRNMTLSLDNRFPNRWMVLIDELHLHQT